MSWESEEAWCETRTSPTLPVLKMDGGFCHRTLDADNCRSEGRWSQAHVRIVGKTEALLRNANEISIQLVIAVLVVNNRHTVIARGQILPHSYALALACRDGGGSVPERLLRILRPTIGGGEYHGPDIAG